MQLGLGKQTFPMHFTQLQDHLRPLLTEINSTFAALAKRFEDFHSLGPQVGRKFQVTEGVAVA